MLTRSLRGARELEPHLGDPRVLQMYGQLQLYAALATATLAREDDTTAHLDEATRLAERAGPPAGHGFGDLNFGATNVGIWTVAIAVEPCRPDTARKVADTVHPETLPSPTRQAMFYADLGRGLAVSATRHHDVVTLA